MITLDLPVKRVPVGTLFQHVSRTIYRASPLHFGKDGVHRYDDPTASYGVLYIAFELTTALMESVFHQHTWSKKQSRTITTAEVQKRMVRAVGVTAPLRLANLTATGVVAARLGLNLSQLASRHYIHTQRISKRVHAVCERNGKHRFDGILYPSRNNPPATCVALFDRAEPKISLIDDIELRHHVGWPKFISEHFVTVRPR